MENISLYGPLYYQRSEFKGSYRGMNFRIKKVGEEEPYHLQVTAWKGPFILEKSGQELLVREFELSEEGIEQADKWLTETQPLITAGQN